MIVKTMTEDVAENIKLLVYGKSGIGKSHLISTAPTPLILSSEKKALSLRRDKIPFWRVSSSKEVKEAIEDLSGREGKEIQTVCVDSISDIAELVLTECKIKHKDGRQAYGEMADICADIIRRLRDIPDMNLYVIAKMAYLEDEYSGITLWQPTIPGKSLMVNLPYFFDLIFPLREAKTENGQHYRYLQTESDVQYIAKGDKEALNSVEEPHLTKLFAKILGK